MCPKFPVYEGLAYLFFLPTIWGGGFLHHDPDLMDQKTLTQWGFSWAEVLSREPQLAQAVHF